MLDWIREKLAALRAWWKSKFTTQGGGGPGEED